MKCRNCATENQPTARFCENCGESLARACPNCGELVSPTAKFCSNCGFKLAPGVTTPSPSPFIGSSAGLASEREEAAARPTSLKELRGSTPAPLAKKILAQRDRIEGERKLVTALFADIVGSTALAEAMDPEDWREVVSGAHRRVSQAIYRYEGTIAQLLGDGVLAFFGAPLAHEDDAERAVRAALEMLAAIRTYCDELRHRNLVPDFRMRIGLNTGTVVAGQIGSDLHMEYLAIGDTVNLATRVQSAADPDTVLITDKTYTLSAANCARRFGPGGKQWQLTESWIIPHLGLRPTCRGRHPGSAGVVRADVAPGRQSGPHPARLHRGRTRHRRMVCSRWPAGTWPGLL